MEDILYVGKLQDMTYHEVYIPSINTISNIVLDCNDNYIVNMTVAMGLWNDFGCTFSPIPFCRKIWPDDEE